MPLTLVQHRNLTSIPERVDSLTPGLLRTKLFLRLAHKFRVRKKPRCRDSHSPKPDAVMLNTTQNIYEPKDDAELCEIREERMCVASVTGLNLPNH